MYTHTYLDGVLDVDDIASVESGRRKRRDVYDVVIEGVIAGLHLAARYTEYVTLTAVFSRVGPHVNYLTTIHPLMSTFTPVVTPTDSDHRMTPVRAGLRPNWA